MSVAPWEFVNNVVSGSQSLEGYSTFLTNRTISSNPRLFGLRVFDMINSLEWSSVPEEVRASITANLIRRLPRFNYKYIKNAKVQKLWQDEDIQTVMIRMNCSETEAELYISKGYVTEDILDKWKTEGFYK